MVQLAGGLGAGLAIIALLIAWQLHKGPVSLSFLTPHVESALNSGHRTFRLAFDDTTLTWAGWDRAVELRIKNVRAIGDGGSAIARIPELSLSLSAPALLGGTLAPRDIELLGPDIRVRRDADGAFGIEIAADGDEGGGRVAAGLLGWLLKKPAPGSPMSYLETVRVSGATVAVDDRMSGRVWQAPVGYLRLDRAPHGLLAEGSVLLDVDGRVADVTLTGSYQTDRERLDMTARFADIAPASFAALDARLAPLGAIDLPLGGTVLIGFSLTDGLDTVGFNMEGRDGALNLPAPVAQTLPVERVRLRGLYSRAKGVISVDAFEAELAPGTRVKLPQPLDHALPVESLSAEGRFAADAGRLDLDRLTLALGGPTLELAMTADGIGAGGTLGLTGTATLSDVPVDDVDVFWPAALGADAHAWVTAHLADGEMSRARAEFDLGLGADGTLAVNAIDGTMAASGVTVTYLEGMPPVTDAAALMAFDASTFDIAVERGRSGDIEIAGGTIHISGLDVVDQYADVDLRIEAPVQSALRLIDRDRLGFATAMGIRAEDAAGSADVGLQLRFLLAKDLTWDQVEVTAEAALSDVAMKDVIFDRDIDAGDLQLSVDRDGMSVTGNVTMGRIPVNLTWDENFADDAPFRASYVLSASINDVRKVRELGIDPGPTAAELIAGGVDATVRYTVFDGRRARVDVGADIARAEVRVPVLNLRKAPGDSGRAAATILIENGLITRVPSFEVETGDMSLEGDIVYSAGGLGLERVNLTRVQYGRTDVTGAVIARADGSWEIGLTGESLDFTPLWDRLVRDVPGRDEIDLPDLTVAVELNRLWVDKNRFLGAVSGTFVHERDIWRTVLVDARMNDAANLNINMSPDDTGNRVLSVRAGDAGDALRFLDKFDNMYGGRLEISGRYDDAAPGRPLRGKMHVDAYRVRNAPLLTRILSLMALTGILEALTGEGLSFTELDVPFIYREGELTIENAKATGPSLGFTATGTVYTHADVVNIEGTVVPAYALNSLLGRIPILGDIFTGNEEGGGMFAASFAVSGPVEDPNTTVNPLTALTPGIFRNLFGALGKGGVDGDRTLLPPEPLPAPTTP